MIDTKGREWLRISEFSTRVGVSRRTVYNWLAKGGLDTRVGISGTTWIALDSAFKHEADEAVRRVGIKGVALHG